MLRLARRPATRTDALGMARWRKRLFVALTKTAAVSAVQHLATAMARDGAAPAGACA